MRRAHAWWLVCIMLAALLVLAACAPSATPDQSEPSIDPRPTMTPASEVQQEAPAPTYSAIQPTPARTYSNVQPTPAPAASPAENRVVEMEWPANLRMGESDVIRLALVPTRDGYVARAEFPEHDVTTHEVIIPRPNGYTLYAIARLDGVSFDISPAGDQERYLPEDEEIAWRWSIAPRAPGQQRLSVQLRLRWIPQEGVSGSIHESFAYGRGIDVQVNSFLGLSRSQAGLSGVAGLVLGCTLLATGLFGKRRKAPSSTRYPGVIQTNPPAHGPIIEAGIHMILTPEERDLLRMLFAEYSRLALENEFLSGYSGARTFLARPIRPDGCADALTIVKLGPLEAIQQECDNYEIFVKDRLPPVTARIQRPPVALITRRGKTAVRQAAMQYTFIAEPGRSPVSLRRALLENPDPHLLEQLFDTFGPNWWMQRRTWSFRLGQEYDGLLPPHFVLEPVKNAQSSQTKAFLEENLDPARVRLQEGELVQVSPFKHFELRADKHSYSLLGLPVSGRPALRLRWLGTQPPRSLCQARISATRSALLQQSTAGFDRFGLSDPLELLPDLLEETLMGARSVIHGDLNLENILVGPGNLVWLIDFAMTREGHPLYDFAHLESELIAHILVEQAGSPHAYLDQLQQQPHPLTECLHHIVRRCLHDPAQPREYWLALFMACVGALKYQNLSNLSKHCLYLTAANLASGELKQR